MYAADIAENSLVVQKTETEDDLNKVNEEETEKIRTEWQKIDGNWYYYNEDRTLRTGWLKLGKYYYYLDKKDEYPGRMVANQK